MAGRTCSTATSRSARRTSRSASRSTSPATRSSPQVVAGIAGLRAGRFAHTLVDAHVYVDHIDGLREQLARTPTPAPRLVIAANADGSAKGLDALSMDDFEVVGYSPQPTIRFPVAV